MLTKVGLNRKWQYCIVVVISKWVSRLVGGHVFLSLYFLFLHLMHNEFFLLAQQCCGSVSFGTDPRIPNTYYGSGVGSGSRTWYCSFRQWPSRCKKIILLFKGAVPVHLHHSSKIKSQGSHRTVEIQSFLKIFVWWWRIRIREVENIRIRIHNTVPIPQLTLYNSIIPAWH